MASVTKRARWAFAAAVLIVGLAVAVWQWRGSASPDSARGPIVLISIDTLRADRLPIYGSTRTTTPHIDALARDAIDRKSVV